MQPLMGIEPLNSHDSAFSSIDLKGDQSSFPATALSIDFQSVERFSALLEEGSAFNQEVLTACEQLITRGSPLSQMDERIAPTTQTLSMTTNLDEGFERVDAPLSETLVPSMGVKPKREPSSFPKNSIKSAQPQVAEPSQPSVTPLHFVSTSQAPIRINEGLEHSVDVPVSETLVASMGVKPKREPSSFPKNSIKSVQPQVAEPSQPSVTPLHFVPTSQAPIRISEGVEYSVDVPVSETLVASMGVKPKREPSSFPKNSIKSAQPQVAEPSQPSVMPLHFAPTSQVPIRISEGGEYSADVSVSETLVPSMGVKPKREPSSFPQKTIESVQPQVAESSQPSVIPLHFVSTSQAPIRTNEGGEYSADVPVSETLVPSMGVKPKREPSSFPQKTIESVQPQVVEPSQPSVTPLHFAPTSQVPIRISEGVEYSADVPVSATIVPSMGVKPKHEPSSFPQKSIESVQSQVAEPSQSSVMPLHFAPTSQVPIRTNESGEYSADVPVSETLMGVDVKVPVAHGLHSNIEKPLQEPPVAMMRVAHITESTQHHSHTETARTESLLKPAIMPEQPYFTTTVESERVIEKGAIRHEVEVRGRDEFLSRDTVQVIAPTMMPIVLPHLTAEVASPQMLSNDVAQQFILAAQAVADAIMVSSEFVRGEGQLLIRLQSDVLGGSEVRLVAQAGELTVIINPASADVSTIIEANRTQFEQYLAEKVQSWRVSVAVKRGGREDECL